MKKATVFIVLLCLILPLSGLCATAYAAAPEQRVYDLADLFTAEQRDSLERQISALRELTGMDAVVVTTSDAGGKSSMQYADDYYDDNGFGTGPDYSGVLFLIDMDNREAYISTCGDMIDYLTDARINSILDDAYPNLAGQDYYAAATVVLDGIGGYYEAGVPKGQYRQDEYGNITKYRSITPGEIAISAIIALIAGIGGVLAVYFKYQRPATVYRYPFAKKSDMKLTVHEDILVNRIVTQRKIETSSGGGSGSGGGRSSTHTSGGGRSHGGGGRKF